jgi:hypothetical protein
MADAIGGWGALPRWVRAEGGGKHASAFGKAGARASVGLWMSSTLVPTGVNWC